MSAHRFALDPEFTSTHSRMPNHLANFRFELVRRSGRSVNQKSSELSTSVASLAFVEDASRRPARHRRPVRRPLLRRPRRKYARVISRISARSACACGLCAAIARTHRLRPDRRREVARDTTRPSRADRRRAPSARCQPSRARALRRPASARESPCLARRRARRGSTSTAITRPESRRRCSSAVTRDCGPKLNASPVRRRRRSSLPRARCTRRPRPRT